MILKPKLHLHSIECWGWRLSCPSATYCFFKSQVVFENSLIHCFCLNQWRCVHLSFAEVGVLPFSTISFLISSVQYTNIPHGIQSSAHSNFGGHLALYITFCRLPTSWVRSKHTGGRTVLMCNMACLVFPCGFRELARHGNWPKCEIWELALKIFRNTG